MPRGFYVITFIYVFIVALMLPFRQLAFQDDFAYYRTVENLLNTGRLKVNEWTAASLVFQSYWGMVFSKVFGFSFKTLHLSVVTLFYFGLISFYWTLRELKVSDFKSVIATVFLLAFPSTLRQTFTFMTDVPYLSLMLISIYFGVRAVKEGKTKDILIATLVGMLGYLNRQIGICIPLALFLTFVLKSVYKKKVSFKPILIIIVVALLIYGSYSQWLSVGGNKTLGQYLYVDKDFEYLKMYLLPIGLHRLRPTSEIYEEVVYRAGYYTQYLLIIVFPLLVLFKNTEYKKLLGMVKRSKGQIIFSFVLLAFLYWRVFLRANAVDYSGLLVFQPSNILSGYSLIGQLVWRAVWNIVLIVLFPMWSIIIGIGIKKLCNLFFVPSLIKKSKRFFAMACLLLATSAIAFYYLAKGYGLFGKVFSSSTFFIWLVLVSANVLFYLIINNKFKTILPKSISNISLVLFFILLFLFHLAISLLTHFAWWESYILPFIPIVIVAFLFLFSDLKFSCLRSLLIVFLILIFSLSSAKIEYDQQGLLWEEAEGAVNAKLVDPREVEIVNWAWYPYFFQEKSYGETLEKVGGDKKKIGNIHTWWEDYEYKAKDWQAKLRFTPGPCVNDEKWELIKKIKAKSVFKTIRFCMYLKKDF